MSDQYRWIPSSNLAKLHAVSEEARVYRVPLLRTRAWWTAARAVCGREVDVNIAPVLGEIAKCKDCVRVVTGA